MSTEQFWDNADPYATPQPPQETPAIKALREKAEADSQTIKTLREQFDALARKERERSIGTTLASKGYDPKAATLVPPNVEPEKIDEWLTSFGTLLKKTTDGETEERTEETHSEPSTVPADQQTAYQQASVAGTGTSNGAEADMLGKLAGAKTADELSALIAQYR